MSINPTCLGCRLANQLSKVNVIYEDDNVCAILDHDPFNEGHILILPKNHVVELDELNYEVANAIMLASMKLSKIIKKVLKPNGITICQNGGKFNDLTHYHMHVIPRFQGQRFYYEEESNLLKEQQDFSETQRKLIEAINELV